MLAIAAERCDGCLVCSHVCPFGVIEVIARKATVVFGKKCIECGACELNCEQGAISVPNGTGCLVTIIKEDILGRKPKTETCPPGLSRKGKTSCCD